MGTKERRAAYEALEAHRHRPLIVYATTTRPNVPGQMAVDAIREFIDQLDALPAESQGVDVLIHSTGGDGLVAWKLMSLLRERFSSVSVLVPSMAFSAATMFALGGDEIVMHPNASLGPIDPQFGVKVDGQPLQFAYEDIRAFLEFTRQQQQIGGRGRRNQSVPVSGPLLEKLYQTVNPLVVGMLARASELSNDVGTRMLSLHMGDNKKRAGEIARNLNHSFYAHGDAVSRTRAIQLGLKVAQQRDRALEELLWTVYLAIEDCLELRKPFHPIAHFMVDAVAKASLKPPPALNIPPNAPPQLVQHVWQTWAQQAMQTLTSGAAVDVAFRTTHALIDSTRTGSQYCRDGAISCWYGPNGELQWRATAHDERWIPVS